MPQDTLVFDSHRLVRTVARRGLLRREVARQAGISEASICAAFQGRPVGVRVARSIAKALDLPLTDLLLDEPEAVAC